MQNAFDGVKYTLALICVMMLMFGCASHSQHFSPPPVTESLSPIMESHADYMAQTLRYAPFESLRQQVEKEIGRPLKNRGEAHITVLTPPEWKTLIGRITMPEAEQLAKKNHLAETPFEPVCIGKGEAQGMTTYFVVVKSPGLVKFREQLATQAQSTNTKEPLRFQPQHFLSHVTLGFTDRDLHEQDGVVKDATSCWRQWETP